ncbi:MAG: apolipoprotein N-acyltransferase [Acidobacteria bacterium]|nr:apolipoprotein N-acyltransferase [Acidobacteriota bacterium]
MLKWFKAFIPDVRSLLLAATGGVLLVLAFPDFELWYLAWVALVPLLAAIDREKGSSRRAFTVGWTFGLVFFFGTCWWLTFAPITYAGFPPIVAYFLLLIVCMIVGVFPGIFAAIMAFLLRRFGSVAMLAAPFVWVFTEFLRYWLTGNNWNAIGYSQAFSGFGLKFAQIGGVLITSGAVLIGSSFIAFVLSGRRQYMNDPKKAPIFIVVLYGLIGPLVFIDSRAADQAWEVPEVDVRLPIVASIFLPLILLTILSMIFASVYEFGSLSSEPSDVSARVVAIQPNVPMSGLTYEKWQDLRERHVRMAEAELGKLTTDNQELTTVIFPESPMNFMYESDRETREFIDGFARRNNVSVLFNSAEPNHADGKFFNSAVLVGPKGGEVAQYDKIYLVPFGEFVPEPLASVVPAFVGSFSQGQDYELLPIGTGKAGVMICFESHFGQLGREYVRGGADVLIEMTNDGYLGPTPILRQHLANAVFRAVETNRPLLRVTNVGITAYITERGEVRDPAPVYQEDTRVWTFATSDGSQTFYVKYGDWFAWLCAVVTLALLAFGAFRKRANAEAAAS